MRWWRCAVRVTVLQGSPNTDGSTALLVDEFCRGARAAGHAVRVLNVAEMGISPCLGCVACGYEGPCVQDDDMDVVRPEILASDAIVFATPLYYYGMTSQLKTVIDRFCSSNSSITNKRLRSVLIAVAWNADSWTFDALEAHYETLVRYLHLKDCGRLLGYGCGTPAMTRRSRFMKEAYALGQSL